MIRFLVVRGNYPDGDSEYKSFANVLLPALEACGKASFTFVEEPSETERQDPVHSTAKAVEAIHRACTSSGPFDVLMGFGDGASSVAALIHDEHLRNKTASSSTILDALRGAVFLFARPHSSPGSLQDPSAAGEDLSTDGSGQSFSMQTLHVFDSHSSDQGWSRQLMQLCDPEQTTSLDVEFSHISTGDKTRCIPIRDGIVTFLERLPPAEYIVRTVALSNGQKSSEPVRYDLSDADTINIPIHVASYLFYPLDGKVDTAEISAALHTGLFETLTQIPLLVGRVFMDDKQNPYVLRRPQDTCVLGIRYLRNSFPSFEALKAEQFPLSMVAGTSLLPPGAEPSPDAAYGQHFDEEGVPCWYVQVNYLRGGMILACAFHHQIADAWSCDKFWELFTANTKTALGKRSPPSKTSFELDLDRSPYMRHLKHPDAPNIPELFVRDFIPSLHEPLENQKMAGRAARDTPMQDVVNMLLHIPDAKAATLKRQCAPPPPQFVSTFDCVSALLYRTVTRARLQTGRIKPEDATASSHAVNVRGRSEDSHEGYFGNAVSLSAMFPVTAAEVMAEGGLQAAAMASRRGTQATNSQRLRELTGMYLQLGVATLFEMMAAYRVTGVLQTSWQQMHLEAYDFGFGIPSAYRSPGVAADGMIILFPTLPGEGVVALISSNAECVKAMRQDSELLAFAKVLGADKPGEGSL